MGTPLECGGSTPLWIHGKWNCNRINSQVERSKPQRLLLELANALQCGASQTETKAPSSRSTPKVSASYSSAAHLVNTVMLQIHHWVDIEDDRANQFVGIICGGLLLLAFVGWLRKRSSKNSKRD